MATIRQQVRNNAVALISLLIALTSLGYNTWRNERTEHNRNSRTAAFEILTSLLNSTAWYSWLITIATRTTATRALAGRYVIVIDDLAAVIPARSGPKRASCVKSGRRIGTPR